MFERLGPWLQENFWVVWLGSLWLMTVILLAGTINRRSLGLPLRRPTFQSPLFEENWRSGGRGFFGAGNCAWVSLLPGHLVTGVHFPFNVATPRVLLRWAGLDNDIPVADIIAIDDDTFLGRRRLRFTYRTPPDEPSFWLDLRSPEKLREAITVARQRV
jgi:hypothetical protein